MKIEEIGLFPNSSVKIKNALAWFKKKEGGAFNTRNLEASLQSTFFRFFCKGNDGISSGKKAHYCTGQSLRKCFLESLGNESLT